MNFNDDDWYVYDLDTMEVVKQIPASEAVARGYSRFNPPVVQRGQMPAKGMQAKYLGLKEKV